MRIDGRGRSDDLEAAVDVDVLGEEPRRRDRRVATYVFTGALEDDAGGGMWTATYAPVGGTGTGNWSMSR